MNVINFSAGPCQLSKDLLTSTQNDILNYKNTGISIYELSHHTDMWKDLYFETVHNTSSFLEVPHTHQSFFMNGGGTHQFSSICYNLCNSESIVQILITGFWSQKASKEIEKFCKVINVYNEADLVDSPEFSFTYYCENETTIGFEFRNGLSFNPKSHFIVCDMCSILGSKIIDISKYGIIFSSLSKNLGISGSTLVIGRKDILSKPKLINPPIVMDWQPYIHLQGPTPTIMSIYMTNMNIQRMIKRGGITYYNSLTFAKSQLFYNFIDNSNDFYINDIPKENRSRTNITFTVKNSIHLSKLFCETAKQHNFIGTQYHPSNPNKGCRISLYNGLELSEVKLFIQFMKTFQNKFNFNDLQNSSLSS